ncbi:hypothetical protein HU200_028513 [Digitaria exilis]|uniref:Uncharacterized protein n=1 Tax=Digitaria exilis TaxID=1010633 RepID=A0A835BZX3_9POAL|nr:hypothetical protein HU200_028513 [Digitaria exilis]
MLDKAHQPGSSTNSNPSSPPAGSITTTMSAAAAVAAVSSSHPSPFLRSSSNPTFVSFPRVPLPATTTLALSAPSQLPLWGLALVPPAANPKYHNAKVDAGDEDLNGEELLRRFTWQVSRAGVMEEIRRRRRHEDARDKRKRKARSAARRFHRRCVPRSIDALRHDVISHSVFRLLLIFSVISLTSLSVICSKLLTRSCSQSFNCRRFKGPYPFDGEQGSKEHDTDDEKNDNWELPGGELPSYR